MPLFSINIQLKEASAIVWIFLLTSFYVLSQAVDIFLFRLLLDIHLAVVAMAVMLLGLAPLVRAIALDCIGALRYPLLILAGWISYLLVNAALGMEWLTSAIFLFRFVAASLIAIEIGIHLHLWQKKARYTIAAALLVTFLILSLIWFLRYLDPSSLQQLIPLLRDYKIHPVEAGERAQGLYVNTNILGFALVIHAALIIWYTLHRKWSILIIPVVWLLAAWGVSKTQSRNALFGVAATGMISAITYYKEYLSSQRAMLKALIIATVMIGLIACLDPVVKSVPERWKILFGQLVSLDGVNSENSTIMQKLQEIDQGRVEIWQAALDHWAKSPWTGIGLGCFYYVPLTKRFYHAHNFFLNTLVEQGIIGIGFLVAFLAALVKQMKDWRGMGLLGCFLFVQMFEDDTTAAALPIYLSLILGYCFWLVLSKQMGPSAPAIPCAEPKSRLK